MDEDNEVKIVFESKVHANVFVAQIFLLGAIVGAVLCLIASL